MKATTAFLGLLLAAGLAGAFTPADLDVDVPTGNPFDTLKMPTTTPTGGTRSGVETRGAPVKPAAPAPSPAGGAAAGAGATVAEDPKKKPPPKPPMGLPGIGAPSTVDWPNHLKWNPNDKSVLRTFDDKPDVATGTPGAPAEPVKWEFKDFPPSVPNNI